MPLTAYMKIPDIPGESQAVGHEDEIEVNGLYWDIEREHGGPGRPLGRVESGPLAVLKVVDKATPKLAEAVATGRAFDEIVLTVTRNGPAGPFDYYTMTMERCVLTAVELVNDGLQDPLELIRERAEIVYQRVTITYVVQGETGEAEGKVEVEIDSEGGRG